MITETVNDGVTPTLMAAINQTGGGKAPVTYRETAMTDVATTVERLDIVRWIVDPGP